MDYNEPPYSLVPREIWEEIEENVERMIAEHPVAVDYPAEPAKTLYRARALEVLYEAVLDAPAVRSYQLLIQTVIRDKYAQTLAYMQTKAELC